MVKISNASNENKIHRPFIEDSKIYFLPGRPKFWRRDGQKILEKMVKNRETYCYANWRVVNSINREYWPLLSGIKVFALLWFSCMSDQIIY